jgi:ankyrin repeat protein
LTFFNCDGGIVRKKKKKKKKNFQKSMTLSISDCKTALTNVDIDDDAIVRMFSECDNINDLIQLLLSTKNERAMRLLIAERFDLIDRFLLHDAYQYSNLRIIHMLIEAGLNNDACNKNGTPPWHFATDNEDESVILHLIANGIDVNAVDASGASLAHRAVYNDNGEVIAALIAAGAVVDVKDSYGKLPIHGAAEMNCPATIGHLIGRCDVNAADNFGNTPLLLAVTNGCSSDSFFSLLINAGANVWAKNHRGDSPVFAALRRRYDRILELMIDAIVAVDVNVAEPDEGLTPMHVAVRQNNYELAAKLVAAGANVNARTKAYQTPLHVLSWNYCVTADDQAAAAGVVQLLIEATAEVNAVDINGWIPCHNAAFCGYAKALEMMIAAGANESAPDAQGRTPLFVSRNAAVMSVLIAAKADVNAIDKDGNSPCHAICLHELSSSDVLSMLPLLRKAGANIDMKNRQGETALHVAAERCGVDVLAALIDAKADLSKRDDNDNTVWHCAARGGRVENLKYLLAHNDGWERINLRNAGGQTLLYCAASMTRAQTAMVEFLLGAGADPQARTIEGVGPLEIALACGHERIAELLVQAGARVRGVDSKGLTACHWATRYLETAAMSVRFLVRAGASVKAMSDDGRTPAHLAHATALPILCAHGANLNAADNDGNTPCHRFSSSASLAVLFALGANLRAVNRNGETPCDLLASERCRDLRETEWCDSSEALLTFAACGAAVGTKATSRSELIAAILCAGSVSWPNGVQSDANQLTARRKICERQRQLFRLRAFQVCIGLQSLRVSALEMCEILSQMFAPLESLVPFCFAWRVVTKVKHFKR